MELLSFDPPLAEGLILARPNRFVMEVEVDDQVLRCHSPVTGRIGNFELAGRPCLLRLSNNPKRSTVGTVQALSLDEPSSNEKRWIGINQSASNDYLEAAFLARALPELCDADYVSREVQVEDSRIDLLLDDDFLVEVKTPLTFLQVRVPDYVQTKPYRSGLAPDSTSRLTKHFDRLAQWAQDGGRSAVVMAFQYDNPGFRVPPSAQNSPVGDHVSAALDSGVELWQVNFRVDAEGVSLGDYREIGDEFRR